MHFSKWMASAISKYKGLPAVQKTVHFMVRFGPDLFMRCFYIFCQIKSDSWRWTGRELKSNPDLHLPFIAISTKPHRHTEEGFLSDTRTSTVPRSFISPCSPAHVSPHADHPQTWAHISQPANLCPGQLVAEGSALQRQLQSSGRWRRNLKLTDIPLSADIKEGTPAWTQVWD